jgi:prostasin
MHYDGHYRCGVVIVSNEVVLTAAHCVLSLRIDLIRIIMPNQTERRAVEVIMHEAYEAYHKNHDVAIIRLNQKIEFGQTMSPVCLPVNKQEPGGKTGRALGWLFHSTASQVANAVLHVNMTIYSHGDCIKMRFKPGSVSGYMASLTPPNATAKY